MVPDNFSFPSGSDPSADSAGAEGLGRGAGGGSDRSGRRAVQPDWETDKGVRWSRQEGSVYLLDQKVPVGYRWVRDRLRHAEMPLQTYERLREPYVK